MLVLYSDQRNVFFGLWHNLIPFAPHSLCNR